jgi:hypothetical protein
MRFLPTLTLGSALPAAALVGPLASAQIVADDPRLLDFARSAVDFSPATSADLSPDVTQPAAATGAPNQSFDPNTFAPIGLVSLGDAPAGEAPGSITLDFNQAITNGSGADFAVFENASDFGSGGASFFFELAFVEVSTDGATFARFPTVSTTTLSSPGNYDGDFTNDQPLLATDLIPDFSGGQDFGVVPAGNTVTGFAGVDAGNVGTLFDLDALAAAAEVAAGTVNLAEINFVRLVDVPGDGRFADSQGNPIFDAFSPNNATGGFDLDAVGVINQVPEPGSAALLAMLTGVIARRRSVAG